MLELALCGYIHVLLYLNYNYDNIWIALQCNLITLEVIRLKTWQLTVAAQSSECDSYGGTLEGTSCFVYGGTRKRKYEDAEGYCNSTYNATHLATGTSILYIYTLFTQIRVFFTYQV